jgi:hypothetical protein
MQTSNDVHRSSSIGVQNRLAAVTDLLPLCSPALGKSNSFRSSHAFFRQLLLGFFVLGELLEAHAAQDILRLGELDIVIADDLDAVAPRIAEIEKAAV